MAEQNAIALTNPPATRPPVTASFFPKGGLVPDSFESLWRLADVFAASSMVPKQMIGKPADVFVAIQMGLELNLSPMQALQNIAVINGRPSLWGDAVIALVRASGRMEEFDEYFEGTPYQDNYQAVCVLKRAGDKKPIKREFSVADAKLAKLWAKEGPWQQYPKRMLQMRARSWALRDGFGDVLRGVRTAEEMMDEPPAIEMRHVPAAVVSYEPDVPTVDMAGKWAVLFSNWPTLPTKLHDALRMFVNQTAEANGCTAAEVIDSAVDPENADDFISSFHAWRAQVKQESKNAKKTDAGTVAEGGLPVGENSAAKMPIAGQNQDLGSNHSLPADSGKGEGPIGPDPSDPTPDEIALADAMNAIDEHYLRDWNEIENPWRVVRLFWKSGAKKQPFIGNLMKELGHNASMLDMRCKAFGI